MRSIVTVMVVSPSGGPSLMTPSFGTVHGTPPKPPCVARNSLNVFGKACCVDWPFPDGVDRHHRPCGGLCHLAHIRTGDDCNCSEREDRRTGKSARSGAQGSVSAGTGGGF